MYVARLSAPLLLRFLPCGSLYPVSTSTRKKKKEKNGNCPSRPLPRSLLNTGGLFVFTFLKVKFSEKQYAIFYIKMNSQ